MFPMRIVIFTCLQQCTCPLKRCQFRSTNSTHTILSSTDQHFGPKTEGVTGEWRKLHNEELNDLHFSPSIVRLIKWRRMRWAGHVARMEEGRGVHKVLVGKPEGKKPLGRPRRRWEDNIKMDLQEVGRGCGDWMELAQDRERWRDL